MKLKMIASSLILAALPASVCIADEWPQWMGPTRDGVYRETGIVDAIPEQGLPVLWRTPIHGGYSGPAVANGRVFVTDYVVESGASTNGPGTRDPITGSERILCLDAKTGEQIWTHAYARPYSISFGSGPRATPAVDGEHVYALGAEGDLVCLNAASGDLVWHKELAVEFPTKESPIWGHAAHPLVYQDLVFCLGSHSHVAIALNKLTGEVVWQALSASEMGYCPPSMHKLGGQDTLVIWHADSVNGLKPLTGEVLWTYELKPQYAMSIAAPVLRDNRMFVSGIGKTAAMIEFDANGMPAETLWKGKTGIGVYSGNSTALFQEEAIYGADCETGMVYAVDPKDGTRLWETLEFTAGGARRASSATAYLIEHEDQVFIFTETGDLVIAELSPAGYETKGRMHVLEATNNWSGRDVVWSHPAFADKCMFARNDKEIVCVSLAE